MSTYNKAHICFLPELLRMLCLILSQLFIRHAFPLVSVHSHEVLSHFINQSVETHVVHMASVQFDGRDKQALDVGLCPLLWN